MDIKQLLNNEVAAARAELDDRAKQDAARSEEAARQFAPVAAAMEQLRSEVAEHSDISFQISAHSVTVRLGDETKIDSHRYGFNNEFCVEVTSWYKYPEPEVVEQTRKFETAEAAVEFIVPICARHIAGKVKR